MIRKAEEKDASTLGKLAHLLWEYNAESELTREFSDLLKDPEAVVFIAFDEETSLGFAQCQLRHDYVEGTDSSPVGYLEGIYVKKEYRKRGYAGELLKACEKWSKEMGCSEFASDCELENDMSLNFHLKFGFKEANRIICFTKKL